MSSHVENTTSCTSCWKHHPSVNHLKKVQKILKFRFKFVFLSRYNLRWQGRDSQGDLPRLERGKMLNRWHRSRKPPCQRKSPQKTTMLWLKMITKSPSHPSSIDIHGIVLGSQEAIFDQVVLLRADPVPVRLPREDLHPTDVRRPLCDLSLCLKSKLVNFQ